MIKATSAAPLGRQMLERFRSIRVLAVAVLLAAPGPAFASKTDGNGVLLFNYSSVTAYLGETSNPAPSCVNNQGQIPEPMIVAAGSIGSPSEGNQDIEFTAQDGGGAAKCQELYLDSTLQVWQYPFNLSFSSGLPAINYVFGSSPAQNSETDCVLNTPGNVVGLYQALPCTFQSVGEPTPHFIYWEFLNNGATTVYPPGASYYYTLTSLAGPAQANPPPGVAPGVTGSGNACSAPNWNSCVLIQVYNIGQGPGSSVVSAQVPSAQLASAQVPSSPADRVTSALPASRHPSLIRGIVGFEANVAEIHLNVSASAVSASLVQKYGQDHIINRLDLLLTVTGRNGSGVYTTKSLPVSVTAPTTNIWLPLSFSRNDASAIQRLLADGQCVEIGVQILQHIITPKGVFELPVVKHGFYSTGSSWVSFH